MRIGFDARWYNESGVGTYVAELLGAMSSLNRGFDLLVYEDPGNPVPGITDNAIVRIPLRARKYSLGEQRELRQRCAVDQLDVLHVPFHVVPYFLPVPVIVTVHDLIPFRFPIYPLLKQQLIKIGCRISVRQAAHIIAVSCNTSSDVQQLLGIPPVRISIIPEAASPDVFHPHATSAELDYLHQRFNIRLPYVLVSSARNWQTKNLENALMAVVVARQQSGITFQTVICGPQDGVKALQDANSIRELDSVMTGFISSDDLGTLFRHATAFLMPSLYEGFGLPVLEAMACGCPVITSNAGSLAEVAGGGAKVFDPADVQGMGSAVAALLRDSELRRCWKLRAQHRANAFSWKRTAEQTMAVYRRVYRSAVGRNQS